MQKRFALRLERILAQVNLVEILYPSRRFSLHSPNLNWSECSDLRGSLFQDDFFVEKFPFRDTIRSRKRLYGSLVPENLACGRNRTCNEPSPDWLRWLNVQKW